jgi:hypothetical protein
MTQGESKSQLSKDFGVFLQGGFWAALLLALLLCAAAAAAIVYGNVFHGINPFPPG